MALYFIKMHTSIISAAKLCTGKLLDVTNHKILAQKIGLVWALCESLVYQMTDGGTTSWVLILLEG